MLEGLKVLEYYLLRTVDDDDCKNEIRAGIMDIQDEFERLQERIGELERETDVIQFGEK